MSRESLEQFREAYRQDSALQRRLQERLTAAADKESFVRAIVELAQEGNYDVTFSEVEELIQQQAANRGIDAPTVENAIEQLRAIEESEQQIW